MKNNGNTTKLKKGEVTIYEFNDITLHVYNTKDPIGNITYIFEKNNNGVVLEPPPFYDNMRELEEYIDSVGMNVEAILPAYHMAGGNFSKGTPVFSTKNAENYAKRGSGKALIENFKTEYGADFDHTLFKISNVIDGDTITIAGIKFNIETTRDAFNIEIPEINVGYIHMLGHHSHSIILGRSHADVMIDELEKVVKKGYDMVLTSHHMPENMLDVKTKIAYLKDLKEIAKKSESAELFELAVRQKYPQYANENFLDMTISALYHR